MAPPAPSASAPDRPPLCRERILCAAVRVVDAEGLGALTMRRLANDLGVGTMSLYTYVPNKEDLLDGVIGTVLSEICIPVPRADDPIASARHILREFRRVATRHPNLVPLLTSRAPATPEALRVLEAGFDALRRAGVDPAGAVQAYRLLVSFAIGFVSLEVGGFFRQSAEATFGMLPLDPPAAEEFPRIVEAGPHLLEWDPDAEFEAGADLMFSLLRRQAGQNAGG